jgi:hypothetical protein
VVARRTTDFQDFWKATLARPRFIAATRGSVRAIATFPSRTAFAARVRVTDGVRVLLDRLVPDLPMAFVFANLQGNRPALLFDGFSGGAHCCFDSVLLSLGSSDAGRVTLVRWGDPGYSLMRSAYAGGDVFRTADKDMAYAFASFAGSTFSIKILRYRDGAMADVTDDYPWLIEHDAREQWNTYLKRRSDPSAIVRHEGEAPLVSYLADEYRLGGASQAWARVRAATVPDHEFDVQALAWLQAHGYVR